METACNEGDPGLILGVGRSPGEGNAKTLQYSCLENSTDRGAWWAAVHGITESDVTVQLTLDFQSLPRLQPTSWEAEEPPGQPTELGETKN